MDKEAIARVAEKVRNARAAQATFVHGITPDDLDAIIALQSTEGEGATDALILSHARLRCALEMIAAGHGCPMALADDTLKATLSPAEPSPLTREGWQPIETAPRPCQPVLVWSAVYSAPVIAKSGNDGSFWEGDWEFEVRATHWMPLPAPPASPEQREARLSDTEGSIQ
jgi:hypothetical protein